jgi:cytidylate kinase
MGSLGDDIAKAVAEILEYNFVDQSKLSDALSDQGIPAPEFEKFDEKKPTIWQSMSDQKKKFTFLLRAVVYDFASNGNAVILGRGGQALLKEIPGTLHVRVVAPLDTRVRRLMDIEAFDEKTCEQLILQSDRDSAGFIRSYFDIDWNDENAYDISLNTRSMSVGTATKLIMEAINALEFNETTSDVEKNLADKALIQKTRGILVGYPGIDLTRIEAGDGVVILSGLARSNENIDACLKTVMQIIGVKEVRSNLEIVPIRGV